MRWTAHLVLTGWLLPMFVALFTALAPEPARAQTPQVQTAVVLDFAVSSGLDPLLGRKAADALVVELQRAGSFEVVPRARVEEAVAQQAGVQPPFNDTAQIRLAQAVGARSVFSGRVVGVNVTPGRSARAVIEARQLDVGTGDFINGTLVSETTEQKLQAVPNEILIDEALNKAAFAAVRSMRQITLPAGIVINTTLNDVELSIGARSGVAVGQRFSVLRDRPVPGQDFATRDKIGEVTITRVESDQATAVLSAGGAAGVRTNDRVRQIFVPGSYPVSALRDGNTVTAVNAPVQRTGGGILGRAGSGALGLLGLAALVGLGGLGGGGANPTPTIAQVTESNPNGVNPQARFTYGAGFTGINFSQTLQSEAVVAYLIYRGETANFVPSVDNIIDVVDARNDGGGTRTYIDESQFAGRFRVTLTGTNEGAGDGSFSFSATSVNPAANPIGIVESGNQVQVTFDFRPSEIGRTYYYRVGRISAERVRSTRQGGGQGGGGIVTDVRIVPTRSAPSAATGGYTSMYRPEVVETSASLNAFSVRVARSIPTNFYFQPTPYVSVGADSIFVDVSTQSSFGAATTFTSPRLQPPPPFSPDGDIVLNLGAITIPSTPGNPFDPATAPLFVRVRQQNSTDETNFFRISPVFPIPPGTLDGGIAGSRFLSPASVESGGISIGSRSGASRATAGSATPRVLKPR